MTYKRCLVPGCANAATSGEWREAITAYRMGISLSIQVEDLAVTMDVCDRHAKELTSTAWDSVEELLRNSWDWKPISD
jgi:hypothetical protein